MIYGKGLDATDSNKKPDAYAQAITLLHKDCTRKLCADLKLFGQCSMQVIYSKDRKKIARVEHIPVEQLAAEKCNDKGEIEAYYYSSDWAKYNRINQVKRIPAFGMSNEAIEIESLLNTGDVEQILKAYETNPITAELVQRLIGAKLGTIAGDLLPGTSPNSLVAAGAGVRAVRGFLDKVPATMFQELGSSFFTDMDLTKEILQLGINRASGPSTPFLVDTAQSFANIGKNIGAEKALNVLRSSLISLGVHRVAFNGRNYARDVWGDRLYSTRSTPFSRQHCGLPARTTTKSSGRTSSCTRASAASNGNDRPSPTVLAPRAFICSNCA